MTPENFAYWLNGFIELTQGQTPNPAQWKAIKEHLDLVFKKVTPVISEFEVKINIDADDAEKRIDELRKAYDEMTKKAREASPFDPNKWPHLVPYCLDATGQSSVIC
ncbi:hypothetical protein QZM35_22975 [Burkholderia sp. AU45274]|uniref:hypothetical protein n=1 Tax=Burkholderia sp. AU45274 TaxID=3059205 RepID=UPI0026561D4A|nr:hypothetical protein [Burkholderia sp. AU45274]MDN7490578.1 hypothetical protein [Burkholderia sp. AU45274]